MVEKLVVLGSILSEFINDCTFSGDITQLLMKQTEKGYEVSAMSENVVSAVAVLGKTSFTQFGNVGNITIKDVKKFLAMIRDMKEPVMIEKRENKILISCGKSDIEYVLCSEEFIETTLKDEMTIQFDDGFKLSKAFLDNLASKANLFGVRSVQLESKSKILKGIVEETDKFIVKEEIGYKDCTASYGMWFLKISRYVKDFCTVSYDTDYPIRVIVKNPNYEIKYYVAPFVTEAQQQPEQKKEQE